MINSNSIIAIVDSGIGGLTILKQLIDHKGPSNFIYFADNHFMPYGNKSKKTITKRIDTIIKLLQNEYKVNTIIIACNTASSCIDVNKYTNVYTLEYNKSKTYLATNLTKRNLKNINVIADTTLANQIEKNILNQDKLKRIVTQRIKKYNLNALKSFVLGCTHYELIKNIFVDLCPNTIIEGNCEQLINKIEYNQTDHTNLKILLTKQSKSYEDKILKILNI